MTFSRRDFLLRTTGFVTVSAMVPRWAVAGAARFEESVAAADTGRTLVVLELMGGNDGLNTVVPYADALYPSLRARIGIPVDAVLHLDGALGLNPVMTGMKALWDARRVAVVSNVGYPNSSLSHFSARDVWHTADPLLAERRGLARPLGRRHARGHRQSALVRGDLPVAAEDPARRPRGRADVPEPRELPVPDRRRVSGGRRESGHGVSGRQRRGLRFRCRRDARSGTSARMPSRRPPPSRRSAMDTS